MSATDGLTAHLSRILKDARNALSDLPKWERSVHIFWLAGPFIMLIERSPADLWLSVLALTFAVRSIKLREGWWLKNSGCARLLVLGCLSSIRDLFIAAAYSLGEALAWFRFPLFAMATAFWLGRDRRLLIS